jgi:hypothetical protein
MTAHDPSEDESAEQDSGAAVGYETIAALLCLRRFRHQYLVGKALAELCPAEDDIDEFTSDPLVLEEIEGFAEVVRDIRIATKGDPRATPETVERAVAPHFGRAMEAVGLMAERLNIPPELLIVALVTA